VAHPADAPSAYSDKAAQKSIARLQKPDDLTKKLESLRRGRQQLENQWKLNLAFYKGRQYTYYNRAARRLESLPVDDGEKPRYLVRLVSNQIVTGAHSLLAKMTKTKPVIHATPGSGSDVDLKAAQMAESLLEYWWDDLNLDDALEEALLWAIITGQGYWKISWDKHAGKAMKFLLDPQGKPILDDSLKDLFRSKLTQQGIQPQEKTVYLGDLKVEVPSPFDTYVDPSARVWEDAKFIFCEHNLDPDEIHARWGVWVEPDKISAAPDASLPFGSANDSAEHNVKAVHIGYFRPSPAIPDGRYVVWLDKPNQILEDTPWPYPSHELPFVKFPGVRVPGQVYDTSVVEHAIPLQKELNRTISQIIQYKNLTIKPRVWSPTGALAGTRLTDEPGVVQEYNPVGEHRPEIEKMASMPPYIFDHLTGIRNSLREAFGLTEVSEGQLPPNLEAGVAIDLLQEMSTDRLAPTIKLMEVAIANAGQIMLNLAQQYYIEPRLVKIRGSGSGVQVKRFSQADIAGGINIRVESGSALPRTRAGRQARVEWLMEKGIIRPDQAYKHLDVADLKGLAVQFQAAEDKALRENDKIAEGDFILNEVAYEQALQAIQAGHAQGPDGQPITDPQTAENYLRSEGLKPSPFENYQVEMDAHASWMMSPEFEMLPTEIRQAAIDHFNSTLQAMMNLPKPVEYKPVTPTLQIKATAGPTAVADILNKAGVTDITPEIMSEPPLETWISDSVDKPNVDQTAQQSKGAVDAAAGLQQMDQAASKHDMELQKLALDMQEKAATSEAHQQHERALAGAAEADLIDTSARSMQKVRQEQEKLRAESAKADLAVRTARTKRVNPPRPKGSDGKKK
jgi:hypothetical protein